MEPVRRTPLARWARPLAALLVAWSGTILTGWVLDIGALRAPLTQASAPKANAAAGLALYGIVLLFPQKGRLAALAADAVGAILVALGTLTLLEHLADRDLGIDQLLAHDAAPLQPGRPAVQAAIALLLLGVGLFARRGARRTFDLTTVVVATVAYVALVGVLADPRLAQIGTSYRLPAETALLLLVASLAAVAPLGTDETRILRITDAGSSGTLLRWLAPTALALPLLATAVTPLLAGLGEGTSHALVGTAAALAGLAAASGAASAVRREERVAWTEVRRNESLVRAIGEVVAVFDADGRYQDLHGGQPYDLTIDDVRGKTPVDVFGPGAARHQQGVATALSGTGDQYHWELIHNGRRHYMHTIVTPLDPGRSAVAVSRDVTDLTVLSSTFAAVVENAPNPIYVIDTTGRVTVANPAAAALLSAAPGSIVGLELPELSTAGSDLVTEQVRHLETVLATGRSLSVEERSGVGGEIRSYRANEFPITDGAGAMLGVGAIAVDVTDLLCARHATTAAWRETLRRLAHAVEFRDEETGHHLERMSATCGRIADALGFSGEERQDLVEAAVLHDAGKVAIPDRILLKPGPLTVDERSVVQTHTTIGHQLLSGSGSALLDLAAAIALTHHERWDGTGYPNQLGGTEIPIEGRIAAVADVYDALTSDRPYRPALAASEAITMLKAERGHHFDPTVLDAFLDSIAPAPTPSLAAP